MDNDVNMHLDHVPASSCSLTSIGYFAVRQCLQISFGI
jgi:hypothetical protein